MILATVRILSMMTLAALLLASAPAGAQLKGKGGPGGGAPQQKGPAFAVDPAAGPAIVDTHVHLDTAGRHMNFAGDAEDAIATMNRFKIKTALIMPPPEGAANRQADMIYDFDSLLFLKAKYPGRFAVLGGAGTLSQRIYATRWDRVSDSDRAAFTKLARDIAAKDIAGFGEIGIHHLSLPPMGPNHAYISVPGDHPLLLALADVAAEADLPIDVHFDLAPADMPIPDSVASAAQNPRTLTANRAGFERLLAHNPKARVVWAHVGSEPIATRTPDVVRDMLRDHPNLYMSFRIQRGQPHPAFALDPEGQLKPIWRQLIVAFQDRFVLGSDAFFTDTPLARRGGDQNGFENIRRLLAQLPPEVAEKVASGNAKKIYPKAGL